MNSRIRSLLLLASATLLASACLGDPVEPSPIIDPVEPAALEAVSANDQALPAFINADGSVESGRQLTRAALLLMPPDSLRLILSTRHVAENGDEGVLESDTLWAHFGLQDSTVVLSQMGTLPLLLDETVGLASDGSVAITVNQPLPPSDGDPDFFPIELLFLQ